LGGSQKVARVEVKVLFRSTLNDEIVTVFLGQFVPAYNSTTNEATICQGVSLGSLPGFPTGGQYRLRFEFTPNTGNGVLGETITFDDYRTNGTFSQAPLPVTFISFTAKKVNTSVLLTWDIAGEENVARYEVERSQDGRSFTRIGQIQSHGKDTYTFSDDAPLSEGYYRIKNVDNDGSFKYSTIARIAGGKSTIVLRAFPQPVTSQLTLQHPVVEGKTMVSISNAEGRVVKSVQPATGSMQTYVDMSTLGKGMYFIRIAGEDGQTETLKVIKQ
ncbi:MAG TPA: T9SS type A sorting domain-containing protein, partial [Flavisolibacter sp.]